MKYRLWHKRNILESQPAERGRPTYLAKKGLAMLEKEAAMRDCRQNSITDETFTATVLKIAKKEALEAGRNQHAVEPPSASWMQRARKKYMPHAN